MAKNLKKKKPKKLNSTADQSPLIQEKPPKSLSVSPVSLQKSTRMNRAHHH